MKKRKLVTLTCLMAAMAGALPAPTARGQSARDHLVQPPQLSRPERGSLSGTVGALDYGPSQLSRGAFRLSTPIEVPEERGPLLADVLPSYSPDHGLGEWGMGWSTARTIRRERSLGVLDYQTDDLMSPWGRLERAQDGSYYPAGLREKVRLTLSGNGFTARTEDGTTMVFAAADAVTTERGTYEWYLSSVENVIGERTELTYERNGSGKPFLVKVDYGGRAGSLAHRIAFTYESTPTSFKDFRSGKELILDRRITEVVVSSKDATSGVLAERWRHVLAYRSTPAGTAYYLDSVEQVFPGGMAEPAYRYDYAMAEDILADAQLERLEGLDAYLAQAGTSGIQPDVVSFIDVENDGVLEMEHNYAQTLIRRNGDAWVWEELPANASANRSCRPRPSAANAPRKMARMLHESDLVHVVVTQPNASRTMLLLCDREGVPEHVRYVTGAWTLGANTRLVDMNRDDRPDILKLDRGKYQLLRNASTAQAYDFVVESAQTLTPAFTPQVSWVYDVNGDSNPDIVSRFNQGVVVWYGLGTGGVDPRGETFYFHTRQGTQLADLTPFEFTFTDANRDGKADIILSRDNFLYLFTNRGDGFREIAVPGFDAIRSRTGLPVAVDLEGNGEEQAVLVAEGAAHAITLSKPESGLLVGVDDGKGGRARFAYQRSRPTPNIVHRPPMLVAMTVEATGEETVHYEYDYERPAFHSEDESLLGFGLVRRTSAQEVSSLTFQNEDDAPGLPLLALTADPQVPNLYKVSETQWERAVFQGVSWFREVARLLGYRSDAEQSTVIGDTTRFSYQANGLCQNRIDRTTVHGTLSIASTIGSYPSLAGVPHCQPSGQTLVGSHPGHAELDFRHDITVERNERGQVTAVSTASAGGAPLTLQRTTYDALGRPATLHEPDKGTQTYQYDAATGRLSGIEKPDGTSVRAEYDPVTGKTLAVHEQRGNASYSEYFGYDDLERLESQWDSVGSDHAADPAVRVYYSYATETRPALLLEERKVDEHGGRATIANFESATGTALSSASLTASGWLFDGLTTPLRDQGATERSFRAPLAADVDPASLTVGELESGRELLGREEKSVLGHVRRSYQVQQEGVAYERTNTLALSQHELVSSTYENGELVGRTIHDAAGVVLARDDASGGRTRFAYDALGRMRSVTLPDGRTQQKVVLDALGRPTKIERNELGSIGYVYDVEGRLSERQVVGRDGQLVRSARTRYDAAGRIVREEHTLPGGEESVFEFTFDASDTAQEGRLASVKGPSYEKAITYLPDGKEQEVTIRLPDFRSLTTRYTYRDDGTLSSTERIVRDAEGAELTRYVRNDLVDGYGRSTQVDVAGRSLFRYGYDAEGRVDTVNMPGNELLLFHYDAATHAERGYTHAGADWLLSVDRIKDARSLLAAEHIDFTSGASEHRLDRSYEYDERKFITAVSKGGRNEAYDYDDLGRLTRMEDEQGARTLERSAGQLSAGALAYGFDNAGRVVKRGDLTLTYGPQGQVSEASTPDARFTFAYDESQQRILKARDGEIMEAYVFGGVLTEDAFVEPVSVAGRLVGVLIDGVFQSLPTDPRGSVLADHGGTLHELSAYGVRTSRPELAQVLDYATKGFDADLGLVRMGVRDYDPSVGQFLTPDPLYLESLEKCAEDSVQCALYGYAGNNPVSFVDPTGTEREEENNESETADRDPSSFISERSDRLEADAKEGGRLLDELVVASHREAQKASKLKENPVEISWKSVAKEAAKGGPGFTILAKMVVGLVAQAAINNEAGDVTARRNELYGAAAAGISSVLRAGEEFIPRPTGAQEQTQFDLAARYTRSLTPLQRYQLGLRLVDSYRHRSGSLQNQVFPIRGTATYYQGHWNSDTFAAGLSAEFTHRRLKVD